MTTRKSILTAALAGVGGTSLPTLVHANAFAGAFTDFNNSSKMGKPAPLIPTTPIDSIGSLV